MLVGLNSRSQTRAGEVPVPVLIIVLAIVVGVSVALWFWGSRLQQEVGVKQEAINKLVASNEDLQQKLNAIEQERRQADTRLKELRAQFTSASEELGRLKDVQLRYDILKDEKNRLEVQLTQLKQERDSAKQQQANIEEQQQGLQRTVGKLRNRLTLLDRDYQQLSNQLARLQQQASPSVQTPMSITPQPQSYVSPGMTSASVASVALPAPVVPASPPPAAQRMASAAASSADSSTPIGSQPQTVELPPIVVRKDTAVMGPMPIRGRVVEANPAHHFVVIDQGSEQGVQTGMTFDMVRRNQTIGQAIAVRVRQKITACDVVAAPTAGAPQAGDVIVQRGP